MTKQTLGQLLKWAREKRGLSLRDVERATRGKLSNGHLSMLESDSVQQPSPHHLHLLAGILEQDYGQLMRLAGYIVPGEPLPAAESADSLTSDLSVDERSELARYAEYLRARRTNVTPRSDKR